MGSVCLKSSAVNSHSLRNELEGVQVEHRYHEHIETDPRVGGQRDAKEGHLPASSVKSTTAPRPSTGSRGGDGAPKAGPTEPAKPASGSGPVSAGAEVNKPPPGQVPALPVASKQGGQQDGPPNKDFLRPPTEDDFEATSRGNSPVSQSGMVAPSHHLPPELKRQLKEVANENYQLRNQFGRVPRTVYVPHAECKAYTLPSTGPWSRITCKSWSTVDALLTYAADKNTRICGLNFANGKHVGGGYKTGSIAQEEDLCRRMPTLYTSLYQASRDGAYPFGPTTCTVVTEPNRYMDVLYTPGLIVCRAGLDDKFAFLPKAKQLKVDLVSAAAPNLNFGTDVFDPELVRCEMESILVAPKLQQPQTNTLVLGAWGCGAFGCDPSQIGDLFGKVLAHEGFGRLYREVHFAIPAGENAEVLKAGLKKHGLHLQEL
mmetsp:Transcript_65867/g.122931  ORF Transcript_65867/g.122931 Transcript_65867/m.122931 type:complete len:430 (+) Transcript_65867:68-1357(+)